jgi:hypothetical protein
MSHVRFDPSKSVTFDLSHGLVHLDGAPLRLVVPANALGELCAAAGTEATARFGRAMGETLGQRAAPRLDSGVRTASVEAVLEHLGGELSLAGLGSLGLERWGRALVLVIDHSPIEGAGDSLLEAVLAAALEAMSGQSVRAMLLGREGGRARFLVAGGAGAEKVRAWLADGLSWGEALVRLHEGTRAEPSKTTDHASDESSERARAPRHGEEPEPALRGDA